MVAAEVLAASVEWFSFFAIIADNIVEAILDKSAGLRVKVVPRNEVN